MNIMHLMVSGGVGGIESLMKDYSAKSIHTNFFVFFWEGGINTERIAKNNARTYILKQYKTTLGKIFYIYKIIKEYKIKVIVIHYPSPILRLLGIFFKIYFKNIKIVQYGHSNAKDMFNKGNIIKNQLIKLIQIISFKYADEIIAISSSVSKSISTNFHINKDRIKIIYNGIDLSQFNNIIYENKNSENYDLSSKNTIELIYVGRLIQEKGIQITIEAMNLLPDKFHFTIVGDGPYKKILEYMSRNKKDTITFLGTRNDIPYLLSKSDIFVHMPIWEEGFGITVVEAMASGKICVVADSGAMPEIIRNGFDGYIIEKNNAYKLAELLKVIISTPDINRTMSHNAKLRANEFSIDLYSEKLDKILSDC